MTIDEFVGFIVQCDVCPQQAIVATQPAPGWVCPRCAEVVELDAPQPCRDDDAYPVGKVRG